LQELGNTIYDAFVLPGDYLLAKIAEHLPAFAASIGILDEERSVVLLLIVSMSVWVLLILLGRKLFGLGQDLARIVSSTLRTIVFRVSLALANFKTWLVCKLRQFLPRRSHDADAIAEVNLDDRDWAVLRSAAAHGPGFTTSAPELAEQLPLRPAQIQRSLDRLRENKMLEYVIGSTDGFDNYRVSQMGAAFVLHWERQGAER
jgi:hypothetical protein